jgi:hypothetical protein
MSGSGSGPGGPPPPDEPTTCELLVIRTNIASPDPAVLGRLRRGNELPLVASSPKGPVHAMHDGAIAGSIVGASLMRLLDCMEQGYEYVAIVRRIEGGLCEVEVRLRSK